MNETTEGGSFVLFRFVFLLLFFFFFLFQLLDLGCTKGRRTYTESSLNTSARIAACFAFLAKIC